MHRLHSRILDVLLAFAGALIVSGAHAQNAADGYVASADGTVKAIVIQPDGKALIGGNFTTVNSQPCHSVCRLNADGSVDSAFIDPIANSGVNAIALQPDGKILVGGAFSAIGVPAQTRRNLARLNADGSVDTSFVDPNVGNNVFVLALQADGKVLVSSQIPVVPQLARYNSDGTLDPGFAPNIDGFVTAIALQADGQIVLGGNFTTIDGAPCHHLCRVNQGGGVDAGFADPNADNNVNAIALQDDGKILVGGNFTTIHSVSCQDVCRLNGDGNVDISFNPGIPAGPISLLTLQPDGKILAGESVGAGGRVVRLLASGDADPAFPNAYTDSSIQALALQPDNKILLGGGFTLIGNTSPTQAHSRLARLDANGNVEEPLSSAIASNYVTALSLQPDARILVGGAGGGQPCPTIFRLQSNGSVDAGFAVGQGQGIISALTVQADGRILDGGDLSGIAGGQTGENLYRLNANGSLDSGFTEPLSDYPIRSIVVQADGKSLVGGYFTMIGQQTRHYLARLNLDGSVDTSFADPNADNDVYSIALQPDGKILVAGVFTNIGMPAQPRKFMARLNSNGSLDQNFTAPSVGGSFAAAVALQPDGKIIVVGFITSIGGDPLRNYIARLNSDGSLDAGFADPNVDNIPYTLALQPNGKALIGGVFSHIGTPAQSQLYLARLNADGSVDTSFANPNANGHVLALALQQDGKVLAGGQFTTIGAPSALPRPYLARLSLPDAAVQALNVSATGNTATWMRSGAGPELALPPLLQYSTDGQNYVDVGPMARISGGWIRNGVPTPNVVGQAYYLRALGRVSGGFFNASQGLIESVRIAYASDPIFANGFEP